MLLGSLHVECWSTEYAFDIHADAFGHLNGLQDIWGFTATRERNQQISGLGKNIEPSRKHELIAQIVRRRSERGRIRGMRTNAAGNEVVGDMHGIHVRAAISNKVSSRGFSDSFG